MSGEVNLEVLLNNMRPVLNTGDYVFCNVSSFDKIDLKQIIGSFKEEEGITLIISKAYADRLGLNYSNIMSWITLQIHSSLEAVGLTAVFSSILSKNNISCNVIAGYYHDHIFVLKEDAKKAVEVLNDFNK
jgi:hypothetical protein